MRGSYILVLKLKKKSKIKIGKLGLIDFQKGYYCYVGSALGKNINLENRLERHFRRNKKKKWHIDYLLSNPLVSIDGAIVIQSKKKIECFISQYIEKNADKTIKNFGSSDCKCKGHLHFFKRKASLIKVINRLKI